MARIKDKKWSLESRYSYLLGLGMGIILSSPLLLSDHSGSKSAFWFWIIMGLIFALGGLYGSITLRKD